MILSEDVKFDFNDIDIQPTTLSTVRSRKEVNPFDKDGFLPLFTAPMSSVVDDSNFHAFERRKVKVTLPRTLVVDNTPKISSHKARFISVSLKQFEDIFIQKKYYPSSLSINYILIDVANGHMLDILDLATKAKTKYNNLVLMAGNIASPDTYHEYGKAKWNGIPIIDYARIGIGNGNGCLTTQQTGVGYPMASLISECKSIKDKHNHQTQIIADGGMKDYSDIIKAISLGADSVMIGSLFNKALESASPLYWKGFKLKKDLGKWMYYKGFDIKKEYYGMSTKKAQMLMGNKILKTSEGVIRNYNVEYTLSQWIDNFEDYYRSALSYSGAKNIDEFHKRARHVLITQNAYLRYKK